MLNHLKSLGLGSEVHSSEILLQIFESANFSIIATDPTGIIRAFNRTAEALLGYQRDEVIGKHTPEIIHDKAEMVARAEALSRELKRPIAANMEVFTSKATELGIPDEQAWTYIRKNGERFPVLLSITVLRSRDGAISGYLGIAKYEGVLHALDESAIVAITDLQGVITHVNNKFVELSGYTRGELIGSDHRIMGSGFHTKEFWADLWTSLGQGQTWRGEICNRSKSGEMLWLDSSIVPLRNANGEVEQYIAIRFDVSKRKRLERDLALAREKEAASNRAKSEFLANMSHEIRTPLNGVIGMTDFLMDTALSKEQADYAKVIQESADNLLILINDILDYSKLEAAKISLECIEFGLADLVETKAEMMMARAASKAIVVCTFVSPELPQTFEGDPARLGQVLLNLISNACKFTTYGGVTIQVRPAKRVGVDPRLMWIRFEIKDSGIGMTPSVRNELFRPFSQGDETITRRFGGTGLGLSISKGIVDIMKGQIGAESEAGAGSLFWFEIPLRLPAVLQRCEIFSAGRVAVLCEDPIVDDMLTSYLKSFGLRAQTIVDPLGVIPMLRSAVDAGDPYNVAILYCNSNEGRCLRTGQALKQELGKHAPRGILLNDFGTRTNRTELETSGFCAEVHLPLRQGSLFDALSAAIGHRVVPQKAVTVEPTRPAVEAMTKRILIAEDNLVNQNLARKLVESLGYSVSVASNGREVLHFLENDSFDLILMDCRMPEMDGFETTRHIREMKSDAGQVPIIALTANAIAGDDLKCLAAGMNAYLSKPIRKEKLRLVLKQWI